MGFLDSLMTYAGSWSEVSRDKLSANELKTVENITVISRDTDWGTSVSMCFFMKAGGRKYIPLSRDSSLEEGDIVNPKSVEIITLERDGDTIYRADGSTK